GPGASELRGLGPSDHCCVPTRARETALLHEWDADLPRPADLDQRALERESAAGERAVSEDLDAAGRLRLSHVHTRLGSEAQVAEVTVDQRGPGPQQAAVALPSAEIDIDTECRFAESRTTRSRISRNAHRVGH